MNDRTKRIPVAVNEADITRIRLDAQECGKRLSDYVRERLNLPKVKVGRRGKYKDLDDLKPE